jgi:hypothetical protein
MFMDMENIRKGYIFLLTIDNLIAIISLCASMFAIGYAMGHDNK